MKRQRLDQIMVQQGMAPTRSQAENYIKLGYVEVDGKNVTKPGQPISENAKINLNLDEKYVSRAALKLASVANKFALSFKEKIVLDVGSSTGGFTDFALRHGAKKVIAVDVGSGQLHPSLRDNPKIELHERTDIRSIESLTSKPEIVLIDVSFISLREVLPHISKLITKQTGVVAMCKPQFEARAKDINKGVIKNDAMRRRILKSFEDWAKKGFLITAKADSDIPGSRGNIERFYLLRLRG